MPHKLLLADDSVTIQRVIELTFAEEDITVIAVGDGRQAIDRVQSDRPDIVLADVGMPERDGYEVAAFIKGSPDLAHIPVLLLTGAFEPIDEGRAQAAGCDGVLVKPFEPQMVISRVKDLIAGRRPVQRIPTPPAAPPPPAQPPETVPAAAAAPPKPAAGEAPGSGSIEDYFDRLDAAFASLDGAPSAHHAAERRDEPLTARPSHPETSGAFGLADELANWDPDLSDDRQSMPGSQTPVSVRPAPGGPAFPNATAPHASQSGQAQAPTLAEAFAALLAAEQGRPLTPPAVPRSVVENDDVIEQVTQRVIERLGDRAVRDVIVDVAERLVREEIARIKGH